MEHQFPIALPTGQWDALKAAYETPPRAYHNLGHIQALMHHFHEVAAGPGWCQPTEVALAILYHDAIYDAGRSDNEARSAQWAVAEIARWLPGEDIDSARVAQLIGFTARHGKLSADELDTDAALFVDADMAVLGAPAAIFNAYHQGIEAEYRGKVPALLFRINRRRFLRAVLRQPRIFHTAYFHQRFDAAARANLRRVTGG